MSKRVLYKGKYVEGEEVRVTKTDEAVARYELADGSVISLQTTATAVYRLLDEYEESGDPVYSVQYNTLMNLLSADAGLRRPEEDDEGVQ